MYDYRKMTPQQRIEVLALRRARQYPLHAPPRGIQVEGTYLITAACFEHRRIFDEPSLLTWLQQEIVDAFIQAEQTCHAWCFLPSHYHLLVHATDKRIVGETLRITHSRIAAAVNGKQHTRGRQVWYRFTDRKMRDDNHYWTTINYLNFNAIKHNYVDDPEAWPWSSWSLFADQYDPEWLEQLIKAYPLLDYGKGWDW